MSSGEQLGAGCGEPDIDAGLMPPQPSLRDRALDAGAVFGRIAAGGEKGAIDPLNMDAAGAVNEFQTAGGIILLSQASVRSKASQLPASLTEARFLILRPRDGVEMLSSRPSQKRQS